ncbi:unnamed protein product, partial [Amoebophrya sp. A120]
KEKTKDHGDAAADLLQVYCKEAPAGSPTSSGASKKDDDDDDDDDSDDDDQDYIVDMLPIKWSPKCLEPEEAVKNWDTAINLKNFVLPGVKKNKKQATTSSSSSSLNKTSTQSACSPRPFAASTTSTDTPNYFGNLAPNREQVFEKRAVKNALKSMNTFFELS